MVERVARVGSMSKAAAALRVSQPTVSARISDLEAELGVVLFQRTARGTELTAAGRRFLPYAERCLALLTEAGREVRSEAARRELRLAAPASLAEWLFAPLASALVEAGFDVSLSTDHSPQVVEMLLDGRLDVGVCSAGPTPVAVAAVRLPTVPIVCVARADDPLAARPPGSYGLADLAVRLAFFEWADEVTDLVERVQVATGASRLRGYVKVSPVEVARRLVVEGQALAFLPRLLVARELEAGSLMIVEPRDAPPYAWQLMLVHRQRDAADADIAEVIATTVKLLSSADGTPDGGARVLTAMSDDLPPR